MSEPTKKELLLESVPPEGMTVESLCNQMMVHGVQEKATHGLIGFCIKKNLLRKDGDLIFKEAEAAPTPALPTVFDAIARLEQRINRPAPNNVELKVAVLEQLSPILDPEIAGVLQDIVAEYQGAVDA